MTTGFSEDKDVLCMFCQRSAADVGTMVVAPLDSPGKGAAICDACITTSVMMVFDRAAKGTDWRQVE